jgi:hypothetical protein
VTTSFLVPLGADDNSTKSKLLFDYFIDGFKNGTKLTPDQGPML